MKKEEEIITKLGNHQAKIILGDPAEKKKMDKLNAMKIAMTFIGDRRMRKMTPKETTEIADEFLAWLERKEEKA